MINKLAETVWNTPAFQKDFFDLVQVQLARKFSETDEVNNLSQDALERLLESALILSSSENPQYRTTAYRIATAASEYTAGEETNIPYILALTLSRIGNFPAFDFANSKFEVQPFRLPVSELGSIRQRRDKNTVAVSSVNLSFTDFQYNLWNAITQGGTLGVSAPTSAGKSFVMEMYAREAFMSGAVNKLCYIVPTRALINQVSDDVAKWKADDGAEDFELITLPVDSGVDLPSRAVFVLTQERLQLTHLFHPDLKFELIIVDEAQSISDGPRGVLLYSVLEEALDRNADTQMLLAGPNISEPGALTQLFTSVPNSVGTTEPSVIQNIILLKVDGANPKNVHISCRLEGTNIPIGQARIDEPLTDHRSKLVNLALKFGSSGQSLIYADGPAECEKIAFGIADRDTPPADEHRLELSKFIKEAVHPKFQLGATVLKGVGIHYGRLPALVRKNIEDSFAAGKLDYLVSTSTLLYGVNLPARNLFLHQPHKGTDDGTPINLTANEFWNLAGRAGRLGKEFSGNIFLIDYGDWSSDPLSEKAERDVKPAIVGHVVDQIDDLIEYVLDKERAPSRGKQDELENTFVLLATDQLNGKLEQRLDKLGLDENHPSRASLISAIAQSTNETSINQTTLNSSPTVSPHRQQALYEWIEASLKKKGPEYVIPKHPETPGAYHSYLAAIKRCHGAVLKLPKSDRSHFYYTQLALKWMKGLPLPQIINASFDYKKKNGQNPNIATVIRTTLTEVESDLRFKYVRLFSCYIAVLKLVLENNGHSDLVESIEPIPLYLEVGASSSTMISFIETGLSRYTAGKLNELPRKRSLSPSDVRSWLKKQDIEALDIPVASQEEIKRVLAI